MDGLRMEADTCIVNREKAWGGMNMKTSAQARRRAVSSLRLALSLLVPLVLLVTTMGANCNPPVYPFTGANPNATRGTSPSGRTFPISYVTARGRSDGGALPARCA